MPCSELAGHYEALLVGKQQKMSRCCLLESICWHCSNAFGQLSSTNNLGFSFLHQAHMTIFVKVAGCYYYIENET
ncbi:hypothetical protein QQP08_021522 [Theobroma cacao]|nr:hypothetical protein QQP08_021522 [Theobroma cacao]